MPLTTFNYYKKIATKYKSLPEQSEACSKIWRMTDSWQSIFSYYKKISKKHPPLQLKVERKLLSLAKKVDAPAREKLLLHLVGFFIFRIETTLFPPVRLEFGEDVLQECILFADKKISTYNLRYRNKEGLYKKVYFRSYLWKGITGVMLTYIKQNYEVVYNETCLKQAGQSIDNTGENDFAERSYAEYNEACDSRQ